MEADVRRRGHARARAAAATSFWKRNRVGEEISAVKDGDDAVEGGSAAYLDVFSVTGDSVEG